jgi:hypothetical protein
MGSILMQIDPAKAVLVNESRIEHVAGDVSLFADKATAQRVFEAIDVENQEYFGYHLNGIKLRIFVDDGIVQFAEELGPGAPEIVRNVLVQTAKHVLRARAFRDKNTTGEQTRIDPRQLSVLELAEIVGLSFT